MNSPILLRTFTFLSFLGIVAACSESDTCAFEEEGVQVIRYGTSFGFCVGYCKRELEIFPESVVFTKSGWETGVKEIVCNDSFQKSDWLQLLGLINYDTFFKMPEVIGCPDCADGGAEWIEIIQAGKSHKVTFEFHHEPEELSDLVIDLRLRLTALEDCGD